MLERVAEPLASRVVFADLVGLTRGMVKSLIDWRVQHWRHGWNSEWPCRPLQRSGLAYLCLEALHRHWSGSGARDALASPMKMNAGSRVLRQGGAIGSHCERQRPGLEGHLTQGFFYLFTSLPLLSCSSFFLLRRMTHVRWVRVSLHVCRLLPGLFPIEDGNCFISFISFISSVSLMNS